MSERAIRIGLISDTHGLLRREALAALERSDHLIHAGDIGNPAILNELARLAPVAAVRGNNDREPAYAALPEQLDVEIAGIRIRVVHDLKTLDPAMQEAVRAIVSGHSHRPLAETRNGVLHVNPGSAGPRRFSLPVSVAVLTLRGGEVAVELLRLDPR